MKKLFVFLSVVLMFVCLTSCDELGENRNPTSDSGVEKAHVKVITDANGNTIEQVLYMKRLQRDNEPGSIKHLYVVSPYSGQVIIYSTVKGKVVSSHKRLTPKTVAASDGSSYGGISITINGTNYRTGEVLSDDGMYGDSGDYLYWFDTKDVYHQHYLTGGQILHISDQPLVVKDVMINMELSSKINK